MKKQKTAKADAILKHLTSTAKQQRQEAVNTLLDNHSGDLVELIPGFKWGGETIMVPAGRKRPAFRWADEKEQQ